MEEAVDLLVAHRPQRVAREAAKLGVAIPAPDMGQVLDAVVAQYHPCALDGGGVPDLALLLDRDHGRRC